MEEYKLAFRRALEKTMPYSDEIWEDFSSFLVVDKFKRNEIIIDKGQIDNYLSVVAKGVVRSFVVKNGEEINFEFDFEDEFCSAYASFISRTPSKFYIAAIEETYLARIPFEILEQGYSGNSFGERSGRKSVEMNFVALEERLISLLEDTTEERYLKLLEKYPKFIQRIPQKHLASYLGVKPETLSRLKRKIFGS